MQREALVFVIGLATLLVLPLLLALCAARCWCQHQVRRQREVRGAFVEALPTSEGEEDDYPEPVSVATTPKECELRPSMTRPMVRQSSSRSGYSEPMCPRLSSIASTGAKVTKVCFRKADWRSRQRKPVVLELALESVQTVPVRPIALLLAPSPPPFSSPRFPPSPGSSHPSPTPKSV